MTTGLRLLGSQPKNYSVADEGKYFVAANPTAGTGIIGVVATTLDDTKPTMLVKNNNTVSSAIRMYLDYLRLRVTVVGVGHTAPKLTFKLDKSQSVTRYTSGGSAITPVSTNADSGNASSAQIYFGALTTAAAGNAIALPNLALKTAIEVVNDTFVVEFGSTSHGIKTALADNTTTISHASFGYCPIVIGPQQHFLAHIWAASNSTGITWEFELGWMEV